MDRVKMVQTTSAKLSTIPIKNGQLIFLTDVDKIYLDSDGSRKQYGGMSGQSPITVSNNQIIHATSGVAAASKGDTYDQTPTWGGTFKVPSGTVNATGHLTAFADHTVKIPNAVATDSANGLMSAQQQFNVKQQLKTYANKAKYNFRGIYPGYITTNADKLYFSVPIGRMIDYKGSPYTNSSMFSWMVDSQIEYDEYTQLSNTRWFTLAAPVSVRCDGKYIVPHDETLTDGSISSDKVEIYTYGIYDFQTIFYLRPHNSHPGVQRGWKFSDGTPVPAQTTFMVYFPVSMPIWYHD